MKGGRRMQAKEWPSNAWQSGEARRKRAPTPSSRKATRLFRGTA